MFVLNFVDTHMFAHDDGAPMSPHLVRWNVVAYAVDRLPPIAPVIDAWPFTRGYCCPWVHLNEESPRMREDNVF